MSRTPLFALILVAASVVCACDTAPPAEDSDIESVSAERAADFDRFFPELMAKYGVITAGAGVIKNGALVWTGYYGQQTPGVPASRETLFNVASMTKTVAAETILRLVEEDRLSLDESMAPYWVDPDVAEDPRHVELTPRMALTHSTGFLNWRFFADDGVLRFENNPGAKYGYSGEGFEYVMRYAEQKLGQDFESLVKHYVFDPLGLTNVQKRKAMGSAGRFSTTPTTSSSATAVVTGRRTLWAISTLAPAMD